MKGRKRWLALAAVLVLLLAMFIPAVPVFGANPTVTITVTAGIINIACDQDTWALGYATVGEVDYFSANNAEDDNYATVTNNGNLAVDIEIQGTNFEGGSYDWTLASSNGDQQYSLYANSDNGTSTYDIEVKSSSYNDLTTDLVPTDNWSWSMKFTAPSAFNGSDNGAQKTATVTLVASEHTT
jgi:hypothetical protein